MNHREELDLLANLLIPLMIVSLIVQNITNPARTHITIKLSLYTGIRSNDTFVYGSWSIQREIHGVSQTGEEAQKNGIKDKSR